MDISRKDFFRKSLLSLGETLYAFGGALKTTDVAESPHQQEGDFVPHEGDDLLAVARNEHCLAKNCGCFACFERCEPQAIMVVMGKGIRIAPELCNGCGA